MQKYFLFLMLFSTQVMSQVSCGASDSDRQYSHLKWIQVGSFYADAIVSVTGIICAGISSDYTRLERVHYRDGQGGHAEGNINDFIQNDKILISLYSFPKFVRRFVKSTPPLTIRIEHPKFEGERIRYTARLNFLRNVGKSTGLNEIKELVLDFSLYPKLMQSVASFNGKTLDNIYLNIEIPGIRPKKAYISLIIIKHQGQNVLSLNPYKLNAGRRL